MVEWLLVREVAVLVAAALGAYTDWKTGLIFDSITYPLIGVGIVLNLVQGEWEGIALGAVVFGIGYVLYYTGKLGGGDVKLFTGISMMLPFYGGQWFLLNVLVAAAASSVSVLSIWYVARYVQKGINWEENRDSIFKAAGMGGLLALYFWVLITLRGWMPQHLLLVAIPVGLGLLYLAFEPGIRNRFFRITVPVQSVEEDEVVDVASLKPEIRQQLNLKGKQVFGEREREQLMHHGIKAVAVYRNLPRFGPFIFLGVVASLAYPEGWLHLIGV